VSKKDLYVKLKEATTTLGVLRDVEIAIDRVIYEEFEEPMGPTPMPSIKDLRNWDYTLLKRYRPFYMPFCELCCLCTFGKCDLSMGKRGACGLDMASQQSRIVLLACCIGASTHTSHAKHLVEYLIERYGRDSPIDLGEGVGVEAPITRLVTGIRPRTLRDLEDVLSYVDNQLIHLLASTHTGQEGDALDFESKVLHTGMLDHLAMEVADIAQISVMGFPKSDPDAPLVDLGFGTVDKSKPVIMVVGHNVPSAASIVDYLIENGLLGQVEVTGLCCTAHDVARYNPKTKIIGPISWQVRYIRSGLPDVVVVDEQCIRTNLIEEARKVGAVFIATSEKNCQGLRDRTGDSTDEIVKDLIEGREDGVLIFDPEKVGEVAVRVAMALASRRRKYKEGTISKDAIVEQAKRCVKCMECLRTCPNNLPIMDAVNAAAKGDLSLLSSLYEQCIGCLKCESVCRVKLPIHSMIVWADNVFERETFKIRSGRGAIKDTEIRAVGGPIVFGEIPGVIAFVGCANYAYGGRDVYEMAEEFAKRRYIVLASGCAAMTLGMYKDEEGKTIYERFPGSFDAGGVINVGSCISNSHIAGAAIKIANIFARRPLRANYEEIADYVLNRVGAVGVAWGAMSQKAASIASGFWRLGIPVIVGSHGSKYRRALLGRSDREEDWFIYDARTGEKVYCGPAPEHLFYMAESKEEAIVMIAKLCMRPNDTTKGRAIKLSHYIDLYKKFYGALPEDIHLFVRTVADIPITMKDEILAFLKEKSWKEKTIPDPTLLPRLIRRRE